MTGATTGMFVGATTGLVTGGITGGAISYFKGKNVDWSRYRNWPESVLSQK